jgi:hypothetical protein
MNLEHAPRPWQTKGLQSMAIGLLVVVSVAACGSSEGRRFETALPTSDHDPLPVVLRDGTGLVTGIEPAEYDPQADVEPSVAADPTDPGTFIVSWLGGLCEGDALLTFWPSDSAYALHLEIHGKLSTGCPALGVGRALRIKLSGPISADSILVSDGGE